MAERYTNIAVPVEKLRDYCLSDTHPRGRHKARIFRSRLGLGADDAKFLASELEKAVLERQDEMIPGEADAFGMRYTLDFVLTTPHGTATIRSAWIVRNRDSVLRFITCFVL